LLPPPDKFLGPGQAAQDINHITDQKLIGKQSSPQLHRNDWLPEDIRSPANRRSTVLSRKRGPAHAINIHRNPIHRFDRTISTRLTETEDGGIEGRVAGYIGKKGLGERL
jgi:hypothetical protein